MENKIYTGKTKEEAISNALIDLNKKMQFTIKKFILIAFFIV